MEAFGKPENALCRPKVLKKELKTRCAALGFCGDSGGGTGVLDLKYTYEEIGLGCADVSARTLSRAGSRHVFTPALIICARFA